jgi:hypothetical protein
VIAQAPLISAMIAITSAMLTWFFYRHLFQARLQIVEAQRDDLNRRLISVTQGDSQIKIAISEPRDGGKIGMKCIVKGTIEPPGHSVQVLIFSGDKRWHPQEAIIASGRNWSVECQFGNEGTPEGVHL